MYLRHDIAIVVILLFQSGHILLQSKTIKPITWLQLHYLGQCSCRFYFCITLDFNAIDYWCDKDMIGYDYALWNFSECWI